MSELSRLTLEIVNIAMHHYRSGSAGTLCKVSRINGHYKAGIVGLGEWEGSVEDILRAAVEAAKQGEVDRCRAL